MTSDKFFELAEKGTVAFAAFLYCLFAVPVALPFVLTGWLLDKLFPSTAKKMMGGQR